MFLFKEDLSLIKNGLSFNSNKHFRFFFVSTQKRSKDGNGYKVTGDP